MCARCIARRAPCAPDTAPPAAALLFRNMTSITSATEDVSSASPPPRAVLAEPAMLCVALLAATTKLQLCEANAQPPLPPARFTAHDTRNMVRLEPVQAAAPPEPTARLPSSATLSRVAVEAPATATAPPLPAEQPSNVTSVADRVEPSAAEMQPPSPPAVSVTEHPLSRLCRMDARLAPRTDTHPPPSAADEPRSVALLAESTEPAPRCTPPPRPDAVPPDTRELASTTVECSAHRPPPLTPMLSTIVAMSVIFTSAAADA
mmetsp:Transcript_10301/g.32619  ORF Transcript_10301/g.32619 Transcript_10301/m.32619 type:complete len:262 (+) Transcript_10301:707-1492(+)